MTKQLFMSFMLDQKGPKNQGFPSGSLLFEGQKLVPAKAGNCKKSWRT